MSNEFFLMAFRVKKGKRLDKELLPYFGNHNAVIDTIIDDTNRLTSREIGKEFKKKNNFKFLLKKNDLLIVKTVRWFR